MNERDRKSLVDLNMAIALCGAEIALGGPGSGNWAHVGRPGKRGGSASRSSGGMSIARGRDWQQRQSAARGGGGGGGVKITGNGLYGNDGTATDKQKDYVNILVSDIDDWDTMKANTRMTDSDIARMIMFSIPGESDFKHEFSARIAKKAHSEAINWLNGIDVSVLSKSGASELIDNLKMSPVFAMYRAINKAAPQYGLSRRERRNFQIDEKNDFINSLFDKPVVRIEENDILPVNGDDMY